MEFQLPPPAGGSPIIDEAVHDVERRIKEGDARLTESLKDILVGVAALRRFLCQGVAEAKIDPSYAEVALKACHFEAQMHHAIGSGGLSWGR